MLLGKSLPLIQNFISLLYTYAILQYCPIVYFRYGIVWDKGYQDTEIVQSAVTTKVKGASLVMDPSDFTDGCNPAPYYTLDHADLIVPPNVC